MKINLSRALASVCLTFGVTLGLAAQQLPSGGKLPTDAREIRARVQSYMRGVSPFGLSGALLIARGDSVVLSEGYGLADRASGAPVTAESPFVIGSLSKQFTAAAILKLEMQGKLKTSDTIGRFYPDAPADKRGITLHQLMSHTAGLPYMEPNFFEEEPREQVMRGILALPLERKPGEKWAYSNPGYTLLGGIIERASGTTFERYLTENILTPAGMTATGFMGDSVRWRAARPMHSYSGSNDEGPLTTFTAGLAHGVGAGSIISTVGDLFLWDKALRNGTVLSREETAKLFTPYASVQGPLSYGYGWNIAPTPRGTHVIFHAGDLGGYNSDMRLYPDEGMTVIFLSNARPNGAGYRQALVNNLLFMLAGAPHAEPPTLVDELPAARLQPLAGRFELPEGGSFTTWVDHGRLMIAPDGEGAIALLAGGDPRDTGSFREYGRYARQIVEGIGKGDFSKLQENLSPSLPFEGVREGIKKVWGASHDSLGALVGVDVLGTALTSQVSATTYLRFRRAKGSMLGSIGWENGKIMAVETSLDRAMPVPLAPESPTSFANFDIFSGRIVRVGFDVRDGRATGLTIRSDAAEATAKRSRQGS